MRYQTNQIDRTERNPRLLASLLFTTTDERVYVVPADRTAVVESVVICNGSTATASFRFHHVAPSASSAIGNAHYYDARLAANQTVLDTLPRLLGPGDSIRGRASTASVVAVHLYGRETTP